ncbi:hypothetical protein [Nocardioides aquiterrae]|uniref:Terminase n=1 Tax=Nocardioides aquiterrae TaxID=203799 RepID=A0ABN1UCR7_9ACTN
MARRRSAAARSKSTSIKDQIDDWIRWWKLELAAVAPPAELEWEPIKVGPTWQWDNGWVLPEKTLGWNVLAWCAVWLRDKRGDPWIFTPEQARFILWYYAVDEHGDFLYHSAVLQRLKGWGKDPIAACIALAECFAHVRFSHWDDAGEPVGREEPNAWVQIVAVSQEQTRNTFKLFPGLVSAEARKHYGIQVGKLNVYGLADTRQIQAVTSSPAAIEGGRPTLTIRAETQNWDSSNGGHDMAGAMEGNAAKSEGGQARMLDICNAFRPGGESVGEKAREAWEQTQGDDAIDDYGLMYDSLEAPPEAPLTAEDAPAVVRSISGDSYWLDTRPRGRIVKSILNPQNPASESRRKWYNQITAVEESWADPQEFKACERDSDLAARTELVMFLDASKSDDSTALVACRVSDGRVFALKVWQKPPGHSTAAGAPAWTVDRADVDHEVTRCFNTYRVVGFWVDPSDARDDETGERYWENLCDEWARRYGRRLKLKAVRTGDHKHAVVWDMRSKVRMKQFTEAAERTQTDIANGDLTYAPHALLEQHVRNARRAPNEHGISLSKEHRESARKVDAAVAMVGARLMWRFYLTQLQQQRESDKKTRMNQQKVVVMRGNTRRRGTRASGRAQAARGRTRSLPAAA